MSFVKIILKLFLNFTMLDILLFYYNYGTCITFRKYIISNNFEYYYFTKIKVTTILQYSFSPSKFVSYKFSCLNTSPFQKEFLQKLEVVCKKFKRYLTYFIRSIIKLYKAINLTFWLQKFFNSRLTTHLALGYCF